MRAIKPTVFARNLEEAFTSFWFAPTSTAIYALVRCAYVIASLDQWFNLWRLRRSFFGAEGILGIKDSMALGGLFPSVLSFARSELSVDLCFIAALLLTLALGCGIFTRFCAIALFYWQYSLAFDLVPAVSGYDMVIKQISIVLALSPLAEDWNIAAALRKKSLLVLSAAHAPRYGLLLLRWQCLIIYVFTVWLKAPDTYWRNGQFLAFFLMSIYSLFPSKIFASLEPLSAILTYATLLIEISIPFLMISRRWRLLGYFLGVSLHLGIAFASSLQLFSVAMFAMYPAFLEPGDFARFRNFFQKCIVFMQTPSGSTSRKQESL